MELEGMKPQKKEGSQLKVNFEDIGYQKQVKIIKQEDKNIKNYISEMIEDDKGSSDSEDSDRKKITSSNRHINEDSKKKFDNSSRETTVHNLKVNYFYLSRAQ